MIILHFFIYFSQRAIVIFYIKIMIYKEIQKQHLTWSLINSTTYEQYLKMAQAIASYIVNALLEFWKACF